MALMRGKRISSISKKVIPPFIEKLFPSRTAEIQFARWTDTRRIAKDRRLIGVGRFVMDSEGRGRGKGLDSVRLRVTNRIGGKGTGARAMNRGIDLSRLGRSESFFLSFLLPRFLSSPDLCVDLDTAKRSIVPVSPLFALVSSSKLSKPDWTCCGESRHDVLSIIYFFYLFLRLCNFFSLDFSEEDYLSRWIIPSVWILRGYFMIKKIFIFTTKEENRSFLF